MTVRFLAAETILYGLCVGATGVPKPERRERLEPAFLASAKPSCGVSLRTGADGGRGEGRCVRGFSCTAGAVPYGREL